jgi:hypothetical protein
MTEQEKKAILNLSLKEITKEDFLRLYPNSQNEIYILESLNKAYEERDPQDLEYTLLLCFVFNLFNKTYVDILCKVLPEKWHYKHEDIVLILQKLKSPKSIDALYKTSLERFDYLNYDDSYALARKCIHALGDINTPDAREKLKFLSQSQIPIIKEKAEKQLKYKY